MSPSYRSLAIASLTLTLASSACGNDSGGGGSEVVLCDEGEAQNPISGDCEAIATNNTNNQTNNVTNNATNNQTNNANDTNNTNNVIGPMGPVDPMCIDGLYMEAVPTRADISSQIASYSAANLDGFISEILAARYPIGDYIVAGGLASDTFQQSCTATFIRDTSNAQSVIRSMSTVVHECGHFFDIDQGGFSSSFYAITDSLSFTCTGGDTTTRGGATFARSLLNGDAYSAERAPCNGSRSGGCDSYADVYLDGDPNDAEFDGGDQGFNSVLEETTQYVNSLATGYAYGDYYQGSVSERDGILTFLWYVERYLKLAREQYPQAYAKLSEDECWRRAILTVWGRAWLYLDLTKDASNLGIDDDAIEALVLDPDLLSEIQRLRELEGC